MPAIARMARSYRLARCLNGRSGLRPRWDPARRGVIADGVRSYEEPFGQNPVHKKAPAQGRG